MNLIQAMVVIVNESQTSEEKNEDNLKGDTTVERKSWR